MAKSKSKSKDGGFLSSLNPFSGSSDMTMILVLGAGAVALYWYLNNYGPNGAITNSAGQVIGLSYWQTWFGGATTTTATTVATSTTPVTSVTTPANPTPITTPQQPVVSQPSTTVPVVATPTNPIAATSSVDPATALITQSGGNPNAQYNVDQWNYFSYQLGWPTLTPTQSGNVAAAAGGDNPMSVSQYLTAMQSAGLPIGPVMFTTQIVGGATGVSGIVQVPATGMGGGAGMGMGMSFGGRQTKKDWRN